MSYARRAAVYRTEYREERDIPFLLSFIDNEELSVLEAPCGAGRLACKIVEKVKRHTIIDLEKNMVDETVRYIAGKGFAENLTAHVGNICEIKLGSIFDLIIIPREAIQLLAPTDVRDAIANLGNHLSINSGVMLLDLSTFSHDQDPDYFSLNANEEWRENWTRCVTNDTTLKRHSKQVPFDNKFDFYFRYELEHNSKVEHWDSAVTLHKYDLAWMKNAIPENMFVSNIWGDYNKNPYTESSNRLILEIKRTLLDLHKRKEMSR